MTTAVSLDLQPILDVALRTIREAEIAPGQFTRWMGPGTAGKPDAGQVNPYGCADAINALYTMGKLSTDAAKRAEYTNVLQEMQDAGTGLFREDTHHEYHVTAHCIAALEVLEARPRHPLTSLKFLLEPHAIEAFLDQLGWKTNPWNASHQGAGVFAALCITEEADRAWRQRYFAWLAREADPETGFWRRDCVSWNSGPEGKPLFHHLAGSFHYLFNLEWAHERLPYPEAMVDSCLRIWHEGHWPVLGRGIGFTDIDWVYCLSRSLRQCGHRYAEAKSALRSMATGYVQHLTGLAETARYPFEDLHTMFGVLCALAELQAVLPGELESERPLKLVLDRRPFI